MRQRRQAAMLGAILTALIIALFLIAARWQGVLPELALLKGFSP